MLKQFLNLLPSAMDLDRVLTWIETAVLKPMGKEISDLQRNIFRQAWDHDSTYEEIAKALDYDATHVRDRGSKLFSWLQAGLNEPNLSKKNFRGIIQRYYEAAIPQPTPIQLPSTEELINALRNASQSREAIRFMGREADVATIEQCLQEYPIVLIHGEGGLGKTTLARKYLEAKGYRMLSIWMPAESQAMVTPIELVVEEWLSGEFGLDAGQNFGVNLERLRRCLRQSEQPIGILIDNLEVALDHQGRFIECYRCYLELLRLLSDPSLKTVTLLTSRQTLKEGIVNPVRHQLRGLPEANWCKYFQHYNVQVSAPNLAAIWQACLGNPKAMEILKGAAISEFDRSLDDCWQSYDGNLMGNGTLQHLVETQIQAIQQHDPVAYRLFCRLGAYRYQNNISSVSIAGVKALLWDVATDQQQRAIQALRDRALLETRSQQKIFWLHPMLQSEASRHLRQSDDWEKSHRQASEFWLQSITSVDTVDDAQRLLEAYHHYLEINDYEAAANVLTTRKPNRWNTPIEVGWLFFRFSLLQQVSVAIQRIIGHIPENSRASRLYNLLGYVNRLCGEVDNAKQHHTKALLIARQLNQSGPPLQEVRQLETSALFNLALCYRDCWELELALTHFREVHQIAQAADIPEYKIYATCGLAHIYSCQGNRASVSNHLQQIPNFALQPKVTSWGNACSSICLARTHLNIGDLEGAFELYQDTLYIAKTQQFTHIIPHVHHGLAQIQRKQKQYDAALVHHNIAIIGLREITALTALAKAYLQRGLTYREMNRMEETNQDFAAAVSLWQELGATQSLDWFQREIIGEIDDD